MAASNDEGTSKGPSTDRNNNPVIDPTANVLSLVEAANQRQDDLRELITTFREKIDALQAQRLLEQAQLRADYDEKLFRMRTDSDEKLRKAESDRIDAIRLVDTGNVARAAEVSAAQATALASAVTNSAEALRAQVEQTRLQFATTLGTAIEPIQKDVADLRRVQYEQQGQRVATTENKGTNQWVIATIVTVLLLVVALSGLVLTGIRSIKSPVVVQTPPVTAVK